MRPLHAMIERTAWRSKVDICASEEDPRLQRLETGKRNFQQITSYRGESFYRGTSRPVLEVTRSLIVWLFQKKNKCLVIEFTTYAQDEITEGIETGSWRLDLESWKRDHACSFSHRFHKQNHEKQKRSRAENPVQYTHRQYRLQSISKMLSGGNRRGNHSGTAAEKSKGGSLYNTFRERKSISLAKVLYCSFKSFALAAYAGCSWSGLYSPIYILVTRIWSLLCMCSWITHQWLYQRWMISVPQLMHTALKLFALRSI